jgi:ubiquitin C-terminal hydrolase
LFKPPFQVSPHEFLQAVMVASKKRFRIGAQSDPVEFLSWLLNTLHVDLGGTKEPDSSIIDKCFQVKTFCLRLSYTLLQVLKKMFIEQGGLVD